MNDSDQGRLFYVEITARSVDADVLEEIAAAMNTAGAILNNPDSDSASLRVFTDSQDEALVLRQRFSLELPRWHALLYNGTPTLNIGCTQRVDWAEAWKRHFHTFRASRRLVIKPSWEEYAAAANDTVIELDPGMCFGTGYHGTTRACLEFLDDLAAELGAVSFLDAGCGSGILTLAAARLGFGPLMAFDHDKDAVATTVANLRAAGITRVSVTRAEIDAFTPDIPPRLVVANILASVLLAHAETIAALPDPAAPTSGLILSGILTHQYPVVRERYTALGWVETTTRTIDEWTSGCFRK